MDVVDPEVFEALRAFEALVPCPESDIFENLARLDKQYISNINYRYNVNGMLVNIGADLGSQKVLSCAVKRLNDLIKDDPVELLYWQLGNAYNCIADTKLGHPPSIEPLMESEELTKARSCYSMVQNGHEYLLANTNSANILEKYSRNYEALLLYDRVLNRHPDFGMGMGNKAIALIYFFNISATGNPEILLVARDLLKTALLLPNTIQIGGQQSADLFRYVLTQLEDFVERNQMPSTFKCKVALEELPHHVQLFKRHELFLNFCFKCLICEAGLRDSVFPSLIEKLTVHTTEEAFAYGGFSRRVFYSLKMLNHILEDFATARWIFFHAKQQEVVLSELDNLTQYVSVLDYTRNGSQFGLFKSVFAKLYGILDKIAYWVFFNYELQRRHIVLDNLLDPEVKEIIIKNENYQLLALYSLARDFMDGGLYNKLRKIRNHIAHRFLDLGEVCSEAVINDDTAREQFLTLREFESAVIDLFSITKAAIFYFLNGVRTDYIREKGSAISLFPTIHVGQQNDLYKS